MLDKLKPQTHSYSLSMQSQVVRRILSQDNLQEFKLIRLSLQQERLKALH